MLECAARRSTCVPRPGRSTPHCQPAGANVECCTAAGSNTRVLPRSRRFRSRRSSCDVSGCRSVLEKLGVGEAPVVVVEVERSALIVHLARPFEDLAPRQLTDRSSPDAGVELTP